jgi:hypothetical protein
MARKNSKPGCGKGFEVQQPTIILKVMAENGEVK